MELRNALVIASLLGLSAFVQGCADACDTYADTWEDKLVECGIEVPVVEEDENSVEPVCNDALTAQAQCLDTCLPEGCGAIDGSDPEAYSAYSECTGKCPQAGL